MEQLHSVCMFVEPYTYVWEKRRPPGQPLPVFEGVDAGDFHNIQTHIDDYESWMVIFLQDRFIRGMTSTAHCSLLPIFPLRNRILSPANAYLRSVLMNFRYH